MTECTTSIFLEIIYYVYNTFWEIKNELLNYKHLYSNPIIRPRDVEQALKITPATANRLLKEMERTGMLIERTGFSRNRLYELHEYLKLFQKK